MNILYTEPRPRAPPAYNSESGQAELRTPLMRARCLLSEQWPGTYPRPAADWLLRRSLPRWRHVPSLDIRLGSCMGSVTCSQGCWILAGVSSDFSGGQGQPRGPDPTCVSRWCTTGASVCCPSRTVPDARGACVCTFSVIRQPRSF